MANIIPSEIPEFHNSEAEKLLFNKLKSAFDEEWVIFHSLNLFAKNRDNKLIDAEIDYLLFHPSKGFLVLEVKGGTIKLINGRWFQNSKPLKDEPIVQARKNKYAIQKFIESKLKSFPPISFSQAVCFPDCFEEIKHLPPAYGQTSIFGRQLSYLKETIESIMFSTSNNNFQPLDIKQSEYIKKLLIPAFEIGKSISDQIYQNEITYFSLTEEQCNLLSFINNRKKVIINGCAGSGKTIMALKKAKQFALEGKSVLLLCYNSLLAGHLKNEVSQFQDRITTKTYHDFCVEELKKIDQLPGGGLG